MKVDVCVVGGGIAGLSAAAWLAPSSDVVVFETEKTLGYHATGRSAAAYTECYGAEPIRRLAKASRDYLVSEEGLARPLPVMFVAPPDGEGRLAAMYETFGQLVPTLERLSPAEVAQLCSAFEPGATAGAVLEPEAMDLDVNGLQTSYTRDIRANGGTIATSSGVDSIERKGRRWQIVAGELVVSARVIVDAAGAWGDAVAELAGVNPLGLRPLLRSVFTSATTLDTSTWPLVIDGDERWYFKPEGPNVLGSAASELPSQPLDARPPEIDIALGIERINQATNLAIRSVLNTWAGLRTFTADRVPAVGFDAHVPGFFWLVGQGGYGIKTSPALGELAASLILSGSIPPRIAEHGVTRESLAPSRFRS